MQLIHRKCEHEFITAWSVSKSYRTIQFRQDGNLKQQQKILHLLGFRRLRAAKYQDRKVSPNLDVNQGRQLHSKGYKKYAWVVLNCKKRNPQDDEKQ